MNTPTVTVDVLAVMRRDAAHAHCGRHPDHCAGRDDETSREAYMRFVLESAAASDAVAELIDAADNVATTLSNLIAAGQVDARYGGYVTDLTSVLARIGQPS